MTRLYDVTRGEVDAAWKAVRSAGGCAGTDGREIKDLEKDLEGQLYKIWNRMSSGSYIPSSVLLVDIPKAKGGVRRLGIPTVSDRVAQRVIKNRLEVILEEQFHVNSYAYRPNRSAIDAVTMCRQQCFRHEWLIEVDIKGFFDNLDHDLCMEMLGKYTQDKSILLYVKKFLKAKGQKQNGEEVLREKGTPQGGVVSPVIANLYLHEAFDLWMSESFPNIKWERYADDCVVHCVSEKQALWIKDQIGKRLALYKLELHPEKTRIVYTGKSNDYDHRKHNLSRKFTFLGYDFKPRYVKGKVVYSPGIGRGALKAMLHKIKTEWCLRHKLGKDLTEIARSVNPVIRGWINYYGHHRRSDLNELALMINTKIVWFMKRKHKSIPTWNKGWKRLKMLKRENSKLFCHWHMICQTRGAV